MNFPVHELGLDELALFELHVVLFEKSFYLVIVHGVVCGVKLVRSDDEYLILLERGAN